MEDKEEFNSLEQAVLKAIVAHYNNPALTAQIESASFKSREWTKVGFYTDFEVSKTLEPIDFSIFESKEFPIKGPQIDSPDVEHGGGSLLWGKDGYIDKIEMHAAGNFFKEVVVNFKLHF